MATSDNELVDLPDTQWQDLQDRARQLEQVLQAGAFAVDLGRYLPGPEEPHRRVVLRELVKTELEARYRHGHPCLLDEYLRRYPELGNADKLPPSLIYEEYRVRTMFGDRPDMESYRARFPRQFPQFQRLVQLQPPPEPSPEATPADALKTVSPDSKPAPRQSSLKPSSAKSSQPLARTTAAQRTTSNPPQLPGYEFHERIGKGNYGEVYRASAPGGVPVAVKRMFRTLDDATSIKELEACERLRELRHPYLLLTHSFQAIEGRLVIVMELADGSLEDLHKAWAAKGLPGIPVESLLEYFKEAAEALDFLHQAGLTHRDIKPQNLLHLKGHAKVADFGIAREQKSEVDVTRNICGTPAYMPPEAWDGNISFGSDQYSFALTWYKMRTGRHVFSGRNQYEICEQQLKNQHDVSGVPETERKVLLQALAKNPEERFASCTELVKALRDVTHPEEKRKADQLRDERIREEKLKEGRLREDKLRQEADRRRVWVRVATRILVVLAFAAVAGLALYFIPSKIVEPLKPEVDWQPKDWELPKAGSKIVEDHEKRKYYERLERTIGNQTVAMVVVLKKSSVDPPTFYAMENKVWNDLYATFAADPRSNHLFAKYQTRPGCKDLVSPDPRALFGTAALSLNAFSAVPTLTQGMALEIQPEWSKGGVAPDEFEGGPDDPPFFGVTGSWKGEDKGWFPVFRLKVTEAHCFAEWLGGQLPTKVQWLQAAGMGSDDNNRLGPFDKGTPSNELGVGKPHGPRDVRFGASHVSIHGCRQMAGNGFEWTRTLDHAGTEKEIPLTSMVDDRSVFYMGKSYMSDDPLTFKDMALPMTKSCTMGDMDIGFRVILEQAK